MCVDEKYCSSVFWSNKKIFYLFSKQKWQDTTKFLTYNFFLIFCSLALKLKCMSTFIYIHNLINSRLRMTLFFMTQKKHSKTFPLFSYSWENLIFRMNILIQLLWIYIFWLQHLEYNRVKILKIFFLFWRFFTSFYFLVCFAFSLELTL